MDTKTRQYVRENADGTITVVDQHVVKRMAMKLLGEVEKAEAEMTPFKERSIPLHERNKRAAARRVAKKARKRNGKRR